MEWYRNELRSRGESLAHGVIRLSIDVQAGDEVESAMLAKEEAKRRFPARRMWMADRVEMIAIKTAKETNVSKA